MDWLSIVLGLIFTCVFYMLAPFIYKISAKAPIDSKKANRFALWNSVILFFVFFIATIIIMGDELNTIKGLSAGPAIIYYWINAAYLKHQPKNKQQNGNPSDAVPPPIYQSQNKEGITTPMQAQSAIPNIPLKHVIMKRSDAALPEPDLTDDNETLLQKAFDFLRAEQWQSAYDYSEAVLERDYAQAQAYICELLAELRLKEEAMLGTLERDLTDYEKFRIALRSADDGYRQILESYMASNAALSKQRQSAAIYRTGIARKNAAKTINDFLRAAEVFEAIKDFPDAQAQATECRSLAAGFTERQKQKREAAQLHDIKVIKKALVVLSSVAVLLSIGLFVIRPAIIYREASDLLAAGDVVQAGVTYAKIAWYGDSYELAMNCGEGLKTNAQYQEAITVFDAMPLRYDDAQTELCECRYIIAMSLMDDLKYYTAYTDYLPYLLEYKDGKYAYEYCYVKMHLTKEDATTMSYLEDLMGAQYRNSGAIYAELTDWRITILINRVGENSDSSLKYVSKNDSWFIKIHVSNAPPNGVIVLHYEIIFPDNSVESGKFYRSFEGDDSYLLCGDNWDPRYGDTGIFTINIYDSSAQVLLATASLRITN